MEINSTHITLIPKVQHLESITQYRPIGLCNMIYKIITKIIVHRIRPLVPKLINPTQNSFLKGRRTVDNAILVQEIMHFFRKIQGRVGNTLIKIDLEKAFDRLEWSFIRFSLQHLHFPPPLTNFIMYYVTTSTISILINGKPTPFSNHHVVLDKETLSLLIYSSYVLNPYPAL